MRSGAQYSYGSSGSGIASGSSPVSSLRLRNFQATNSTPNPTRSARATPDAPSPAGTSQGAGSNGKFDYAAFIVFSGAKITNIKAMSTFASGTIKDFVPTPIICEEEPEFGLNGGNVEGGHCNSDRMGHTGDGTADRLSTGAPRSVSMS
mgnify:CR=1 FL=1